MMSDVEKSWVEIQAELSELAGIPRTKRNMRIRKERAEAILTKIDL